MVGFVADMFWGSEQKETKATKHRYEGRYRVIRPNRTRNQGMKPCATVRVKTLALCFLRSLRSLLFKIFFATLGYILPPLPDMMAKLEVA